MCTGAEGLILAGLGTVASVAVSKAMAPKPPSVVQSSPLADQEKLEAEAAQKATSRRRRLRASSLLATSGQGDASTVATAGPYAKQSLGE